MITFKDLVSEVENYAAAKLRGRKAALKGKVKRRISAKKMKSASDFNWSSNDWKAPDFRRTTGFAG